jgi:hypothetical protein
MVTLKPPSLDFGPIIGPIGRPADFLALQTTQVHPYGRRYITGLGKVFKYCRSLASLLSGYGAANAATQNIAAVPPAAYVAGQEQVGVTIASGDGYAADGVVAENELVGGEFITGHDEACVCQTRTIVANTAVASGGGTTSLLLEEGLTNAIATSGYNEIVLNPYRYLSIGALEYHAFMCVPQQNVTSGYNFWGQTAGPCFLVPGGGDTTPGNTANDRMAYFVGDGSVNFGTALTLETGYQPAGFCIDMTASGTSALPLIMLAISW